MDELINNIVSNFQADPQAAIVEASTKLTLEWAEQQRPQSAEQMSETLSLLIGSFKQGLANSNLDKHTQVAVVKSAARLSAYWYSQNKSASLGDIAQVIEDFERSAIKNSV